MFALEVSDRFWQASIDDWKRGYVKENEYYTCLLCSKRAEAGIIYPESGVLYEAERYMKWHIQHAHISVFTI